MKDRWINISYENDELRPYEEPSQDFSDSIRIGKHRRSKENYDFQDHSCIVRFPFIFKKRLFVKEVTLESKSSILYQLVNTTM